jgi:hypothetical protein
VVANGAVFVPPFVVVEDSLTMNSKKPSTSSNSVDVNLAERVFFPAKCGVNVKSQVPVA